MFTFHSPFYSLNFEIVLSGFPFDGEWCGAVCVCCIPFCWRIFSNSKLVNKLSSVTTCSVSPKFVKTIRNFYVASSDVALSVAIIQSISRKNLQQLKTFYYRMALHNSRCSLTQGLSFLLQEWMGTFVGLFAFSWRSWLLFTISSMVLSLFGLHMQLTSAFILDIPRWQLCNWYKFFSPKFNEITILTLHKKQPFSTPNSFWLQAKSLNHSCSLHIF